MTFTVFYNVLLIFNHIVLWFCYRPPQSKILRTDSADSMYVMNAVEVEIKSADEAFEVLYKGTFVWFL